MMDNMGKLADFVFKMDETEYKKLVHNYKAKHGAYQPIKGQEIKTKTGGWTHTFSLNGVSVDKKKDTYETLLSYLKKRDKVRFTTLLIDIDVIVKGVQLTQEIFYDDGKPSVQKYNLELEEVFDDFQ